MDRAEKIGLGIAVAGHVLLFGLLSTSLLVPPPPAKPVQAPIDISLVKEVALESTAPTTTPSAESVAPDLGEPEDAAPPEEATPDPEPQPEPKPQPPAPPPKPAPPKPAPPKPAPPKASPPKPAPPKPAPPRPTPAPAPKPVPAKPKPSQPAPTKSAAKSAPAKQAPNAAPAEASSAKTSSAKAPAAKASPAKTAGRGTDPAKAAARPRGGRLGDNFLAGLSSEPTKSTSTAPSAAKAGPFPTASIQAAIARQIQPCADRQVNPGPGANEIVTTLNIRLNEDGTLAATPRMVRQSGVGDGNDRYAQRVVDLGIAAFKGCTPLKLPAQYYATANGGWGNLNYQWRLR